MDLCDLEPFLGRWKLVESRNFPEYLKSTGAPEIVGKVFKNSKPVAEICASADKEWAIFHTKFPLKTVTTKSRLDGKAHDADLPSIGKQTKGSMSTLAFDKCGKIITVDVLSPDKRSRNRSRRWIVNSNGTDKCDQMILELTFESGRDLTEDASDIELQVVAFRIFEKLKTK